MVAQSLSEVQQATFSHQRAADRTPWTLLIHNARRQETQCSSQSKGERKAWILNSNPSKERASMCSTRNTTPRNRETCMHACKECSHRHTHRLARTHSMCAHRLDPSPIYLVPSSGMSLHDDGSPFSLLRSIVQLWLPSSLINHGLQVNCRTKHAHVHRGCGGPG